MIIILLNVLDKMKKKYFNYFCFYFLSLYFCANNKTSNENTKIYLLI